MSHYQSQKNQISISSLQGAFCCAMVFSFLILSSVLANANLVDKVLEASNSRCASLIGSCEYYSCLGQELNCGEKSYVRRFALGYCRLFDRQVRHYTVVGQAFLQNVKVCLQRQIESERPRLTCSVAAATAPEHHVSCYVDSGFCSLPVRDQNELARTVWDQFVRDPAFTSSALRILQSCANTGMSLR